MYQFSEENKSNGKSFTVKHFEAEGYKISSLDQIIKRSEDGISAERKIESGTKAKIKTKGNITKLKRIIDHTDHISQRKLSIKFGCDRTHINKTIKKKTFTKERSKSNIPKRAEAQIRQVKACFSRICKI